MKWAGLLRQCLIMLMLFAPIAVFAATAPGVYTENQANILVTSHQPEFILKLKANPTTGFSWFLRDYDDKMLTLVKHTVVKPSKPLLGAPGYELWTFRVKNTVFTAPQQTTLRMVYARPWQGDDGSTQLMYLISIHE